MNWISADAVPPKLEYPHCQNCYRNPFEDILPENLAAKYPEICRHETNIHWSIKGGRVLAGLPGEDPRIYHVVVDYRWTNGKEHGYSRSWSSGISGSTPMKGTFYTPLGRIPK